MHEQIETHETLQDEFKPRLKLVKGEESGKRVGAG
jgi:hypothetical protein